MISNPLLVARNNLLNSFVVTTDPISYLMTIDINPTELCNRTCEFCPRSDPDTYQNQNLNMSIVTAKKLADQLRDIDYKNQIHFGGQSEPLLATDFTKIVKVLKDAIPTNNNFYITTNGDHLTDELLSELVSAGINHINVSCYDGIDQVRYFEEMLSGKVNFTTKHFYKNSSEQWGLPDISNRAGKLFKIVQSKQQPCHLPFYSTSIDWNGNTYICVHDWNKHQILGNIHYKHIKDIWVSEAITAYRRMLLNSNRLCDPCAGCDVNGQHYGTRNFNFFKTLLNR